MNLFRSITFINASTKKKMNNTNKWKKLYSIKVDLGAWLYFCINIYFCINFTISSLSGLQGLPQRWNIWREFLYCSFKHIAPLTVYFRYWLDRGNFKMTLKYMNLLKGAPRSVASDWMNETRILLETQQAVDILLAYAGAIGLVYLGTGDPAKVSTH